MMIQICDNCHGVVPTWQQTTDRSCPVRPWYWRLFLRFASWVLQREQRLLEEEHRVEQIEIESLIANAKNAPTTRNTGE